MSEPSGVLVEDEQEGLRTEPYGTPQVRGHDWDDAFDVWMEKELYTIDERQD